jgi:hypothetical protein
MRKAAFPAAFVRGPAQPSSFGAAASLSGGIRISPSKKPDCPQGGLAPSLSIQKKVHRLPKNVKHFSAKASVAAERD